MASYPYTYPGSYPYTPFPGAYLKPVEFKPSISQVMVQAPSPAIEETHPAMDYTNQQLQTMLNYAINTYDVDPSEYRVYYQQWIAATGDDLTYPTDAEYEYAYHSRLQQLAAAAAAQQPIVPAVDVVPAAPAPAGKANVGLLAALAAGAWWLFGRK